MHIPKANINQIWGLYTLKSAVAFQLCESTANPYTDFNQLHQRQNVSVNSLKSESTQLRLKVSDNYGKKMFCELQRE